MLSACAFILIIYITELQVNGIDCHFFSEDQGTVLQKEADNYENSQIKRMIRLNVNLDQHPQDFIDDYNTVKIKRQDDDVGTLGGDDIEEPGRRVLTLDRPGYPNYEYDFIHKILNGVTNNNRDSIPIVNQETKKEVPSVVATVTEKTQQYCGIAAEKSDSLRIIGGTPSSIASFPWMAALAYKYSSKTVQFRCGGALITNRHVLTAAHCISEEPIGVALGVTKFSNEKKPGERFIKIIKQTIHPNYTAETRENDIAVVMLEFPVPFSNSTRPICLPIAQKIRKKAFKQNEMCTVAGWGAQEYGGMQSNILMKVDIPILNELYCRKVYNNIDERVLCAGLLEGKKDSCQGDSGGPLIFRNNDKSSYYVVGVVSHGYLCGQPDYPGVYTKVAYFVDWILQTIDSLD